jgi:RND superfamily putative drug exporter
MLARIARLAITAPKRIVAAAALIMVAAAIFGLPVSKSLSAGGFTDPASESVRASDILTNEFNHNDLPLLIAITSEGGVHSAAASAVAAEVTSVLKSSPDVTDVASFWTAPPPAAPALTSRDGKTGIVIAGIKGGDDESAKTARELVDQMPHDHDGVVVRAGGALTFAEANEQSERDLVKMESIAIPLSFVALAWVFGGILAAALPMAVGVFAILGSLALLRAVTFFTDVSLFAMNLTAAMGLALAVDYTLLIISRYRDEIADGVPPDEAIVRTMTTAGRTVAFSALTVALSMSAMALFPMYFLRSFAYAGIAVVVLAAAAAIVITPAVIVLLGPRLDTLDVRKLVRRILRRPPTPAARPIEQSFWYRTTHAVMRQAVVVSVVLIAVLLLLGSPFLGVKWGFPDDRVLPASASSREVGDLLRTQFAVNPLTNVSVLIPDMSNVSPEQLSDYAAQLSRVSDVSGVSTPTGTFVSGVLAGPPSAATGVNDRRAFLTVQSNAPLFTDASNEQLRSLHGVPGPAGHSVLFSGAAQYNIDGVESVTSRLPLVLGVIAIITFVVLFLVTGSVVLPLKALVLNILSLTATFGALVWIFQDGHLGGLGTTATGTLVVNLPVLMFCIAFGISMDYEVFVLSRIREYWLASGRTRADSDESVAFGVARTGRVVTAAALLMSISFAALLTADVSFMKMFGVGLTIAVLVDATLVRTLLLPALMRVLGRANWWAPAPLSRLHRRVALSEAGEHVNGALATPVGDTRGREPALR